MFLAGMIFFVMPYDVGHFQPFPKDVLRALVAEMREFAEAARFDAVVWKHRQAEANYAEWRFRVWDEYENCRLNLDNPNWYRGAESRLRTLLGEEAWIRGQLP